MKVLQILPRIVQDLDDAWIGDQFRERGGIEPLHHVHRPTGLSAAAHLHNAQARTIGASPDKLRIQRENPRRPDLFASRRQFR